MGTLLEQHLQKLYYDPKSPVAFGGAQRLYEKVRSKGFTLQQVRNWLKGQTTYTLHKPIRKRFQRRKTIVAGIDQQWQADLADMQHLMKQNKRNRYLLCVIDVFSKFAWVVPIKDKTGTTLTQAFAFIFKSSKRKPLSLQTDKGREFKNKVFQSFLERKKIHFFTTENPETKASVVERFQRTLKTKMWKYFTHYQTRTYVDVLSSLVDAYNHSFHRSIQMTPSEVTPATESKVSKALYKTKSSSHFKVHDVVRINKTKRTFEKGYLPNWTKELFKIIRVNKTHVPVTYTLEDLNGERIAGTFYSHEIQPIKDDGIYKIESVLDKRSRRIGKKRIKEIKVRWLGYPPSFDSWISESLLV